MFGTGGRYDDQGGLVRLVDENPADPGPAIRRRIRAAPQRSRLRTVSPAFRAAMRVRLSPNPLKAMPGTAMGYAGIGDRKERADLIAYLKQANASTKCSKNP